MYDSVGSEALDRGECLRLLGSVSIGRIIFTEHALPAAEPVNFALLGDAVVFRTAAGSRLAAAARNAVVAFEADEFHPATRAGDAEPGRDPAAAPMGGRPAIPCDQCLDGPGVRPTVPPGYRAVHGAGHPSLGRVRQGRVARTPHAPG